MRSLLISDLHSNKEALSTVLTHVRRKGIDRIICLGDFVGYGGQPNQVLDQMRKFRGEKLYVRGNHDRVAAGLDDAEAFNHAAKSAVLWTREHLSGPNRHFLATLPTGPILSDDGVLVCHGSPLDEDEYIFSEYTAMRVFRHFTARLIFYGHTHLPVIFSIDGSGEVEAKLVRGSASIQLDPARRYLINPGSVGQPRDRNPRTSFAIHDDKRSTVQFFRIDYDVSGAQGAIRKAGLPAILADRLAVGT